MADVLPDVLTPEQAAKLGLVEKHADVLPDTLTPEQAKSLGLVEEPHVPVQEKIASPPPAEHPGVFDRVGSGLSRLGHFAANAAGGAADTIRYQAGEVARIADKPLDYAREVVAHPGATLLPGIFGNRQSQTDQFVRGVDDLVTLGHAQQAGDYLRRKLRGETPEQQQLVQLQRAQEAPGYREMGNVAGMFTPGAANAIGKGAGALVGAVTGKLAPTSLLGSTALGAARGAATYEIAAPATSALSAGAAGHRLDAARETAADPAGLLLAGAGGAASGALTKIAERAPERVADRVERNVERGEAGGKANKRAADQMHAKAARGDFDETMERHPDVYKTLATKAASDPAKAAEKVQAKLKAIKSEVDPMYEAIDKGPAVPSSADLNSKLDAVRQQMVAEGRTGQADAIETFQTHLKKHYAGATKPIPAAALRNLRNEVGEVAFGNNPNVSPKFREQAQRAIYGAINETIDDAGKKTPGVDVDALKALNRDTSTLITVKDALADRASKAAAGGTSIGNLLFGNTAFGAGATGGFAHGGLAGGIKGAVAGMAIDRTVRAARPIARGIDFSLAERTRQLGAPNLAPFAGARTAGLEYAAKVSEGLRKGLTLQQAADAANEGE